MTIGDLILRVIAETGGFKADLLKEAQDAGDKAGATLGQRMGAAVKNNGAKIIGGVLAAGYAVAAKGLLELENVTADFRAETGATADEAARASKAINEMWSRNIQPMAEIGQALTKVHTDLGLTGDQAERTTQKFLTFGRVTKRNAALEVAAFDDILDAWNLTADHSGEIMDALVRSHQLYGGVIADDEAALRDLAPALIAANQTWAEGLALINLFKASGADASLAVVGITKALATVKNPQELKALIADIIATEDPFVRAQKAIDLFGAKAGAKLANVLKPGMAGIEDFAITTADAAGATEAAAEVLDSTWGARFELLMHKAGAAVIGLGDAWGGLATVVATSITVLSRFGGGRLVDALAGGLGGAWKKVAGSALVTKAVAFASGKAATVYLAGLILGDRITAALSAAWALTAGRLIAAAGISGAAAGTAFAVAAAAAIVAAPLVVLGVALKISADIEQQGNDLKAQTDAWLKTLPSNADLQNSIKGVQEQLDQIPANAFGARTITVEVLNKLIAESNSRAGQIAAPLVTMGTQGAVSFDKVAGASTRARREIEVAARAIAVATRTLTEKLLGELQALITGYYDPIIAQEDLLVQKEEIAANRRAVAAAKAALEKTKAGTKERADAQLTYDQSVLTLTNSQKNLDTTRANLLAAGELSRKDQRAWLADLEKRYKTATGSARTEIQKLIDKIKEMQRIPSTVVRVTVQRNDNRGTGPAEARATGGPVMAGHPYLVNENTPNSEVWVPDVSGRVRSGAVPATSLSGGSTWAPQVTVYNPVPQAADEDIGRMLRRLASLGIGA